MNVPEELKYTKDHEWVRVEGTDAVIGITEFAQQELGDVVFVDLPAVGKSLKQKETVCVVESTKAASDVYAPVGGTVASVNTALANTPDQVNKSPYTNGWMVKLKGVASAELQGLMTAAQYRAHIGQK